MNTSTHRTPPFRGAAAALLVLTLIGVGCSTAPKSEESRQQLDAEVDSTLAAMMAKDVTLKPLLDDSAGYAVFPSVGKGGLGVGGAYGRGHVFRKGEMIGFSELNQATIGLQAGGQSYNELIVFRDETALNKFTGGQYTLSANASGVALKADAAKAATFKDGVVVFVEPQGGLMFEASIGGQKFNFQPK